MMNVIPWSEFKLGIKWWIVVLIFNIEIYKHLFHYIFPAIQFDKIQ